ncbi:MAG TPA: metalloregulator ArsR/SmtB family transcription factor [bacterium]|nr:metalloregulator ArsR/SmtB family transcription factor [bacterium]
MQSLSDDTLDRVAQFLKALTEPNRLKILRALHDGELTVTDLIAETGATQSNVSKHLAVLTAAGMVASRKEGTSTYYRIADPHITAICDTVCRSIADRIRGQKATLKNIEKGVES